MSYEVGSLYTSTCTVVNPASAAVTVTLPDNTQDTPANSTNPDGNPYVAYPLTLEGLYKFTWVTTGPVDAQSDYVNASVFRSIVGIDEVRYFINDTDTSRDAILRQMMATATELAEGICGACVQRRYVDERIPGYSNRYVLRLPHGPLPTDQAIESITSVWAGGPSWTTDMLIVYPDSATVELAAMLPFWLGPWRATYTAGRAVIPDGIQLAVKEIIYDLWSTQRPYGADSLEPGPEQTATYEALVAGYDMPPHARAMLENEAMPGFA